MKKSKKLKKLQKLDKKINKILNRAANIYLDQLINKQVAHLSIPAGVQIVVCGDTSKK